MVQQQCDLLAVIVSGRLDCCFLQQLRIWGWQYHHCGTLGLAGLGNSPGRMPMHVYVQWPLWYAAYFCRFQAMHDRWKHRHSQKWCLMLCEGLSLISTASYCYSSSWGLQLCKKCAVMRVWNGCV